MKRLSKIVPLISVAVLFVLALLPASAPANPAAATIAFVGGGTLLGDGTVDVTLHYSCLPPGPGGIDASLTESATEFGSSVPALATCDGRNHSVTLNMAPGPFSPGIAAGKATVFNDTGAAMANANDQVTIK
jgi:hypothetical protein